MLVVLFLHEAYKGHGEQTIDDSSELHLLPTLPLVEKKITFRLNFLLIMLKNAFNFLIKSQSMHMSLIVLICIFFCRYSFRHIKEFFIHFDTSLLPLKG